MLTTPDLWNDINELVKKQLQRDFEDGTINDYADYDPKHLDKINNKKYLAVIDRLISKCPINGDFENSAKDLQEDAKTYIEKSFPFFNPTTTLNILHGYQNNQLSNILNPPAQAFVLYVELIRQVYFYIQEKYIKKNKDNFEITFVHTFISYSLELLIGINSLLLGGNYNSLVSIYRTFYENYIVFRYLQNHKELRQSFLDHSRMDKCLLFFEQMKMKKTDVPIEIQNEYNALITQYGNDFKEDYGWANSIIKGKNKLKKMFDDSNLSDVFIYYYKLSCKYTHSTALSLTTRLDFKNIIGFVLAISSIMIEEFKELFNYINFKNKKEQALLREWINVASMNLDNEIKKWI
jgi:hypothetical protein